MLICWCMLWILGFEADSSQHIIKLSHLIYCKIVATPLASIRPTKLVCVASRWTDVCHGKCRFSSLVFKCYTHENKFFLSPMSFEYFFSSLVLVPKFSNRPCNSAPIVNEAITPSGWLKFARDRGWRFLLQRTIPSGIAVSFWRPLSSYSSVFFSRPIDCFVQNHEQPMCPKVVGEVLVCFNTSMLA